MSDSETYQGDLKNNSEIVEVEENKKIEIKPGKTQRSDKTKFERTKDAKQRAIDNFKRGIADPEYRVVKMSNDKYRCYKRKESLPPEPIKLNQVPPNKPSAEVVEHDDEQYEDKPIKRKKEHDPFSDIVYFNMSNQISEQLNKRLDAVNAELEKLKNKNKKMKGKYKALKQAIYITEEEDEAETDENENNIQQSEQIQQVQQQYEQVQQQQYEQVQQQVQQIPIVARSNPRGINFNRFFQ